MTVFFCGCHDVCLTDTKVSPRFTITIFCPEDEGNRSIRKISQLIPFQNLMVNDVVFNNSSELPDVNKPTKFG